MLISIVIPAYNASATITRTLSSIFNDVLHDKWLIEVIVVDDGSIDNQQLSEVVSGFPLTKLLRHEKNSGMCSGRNTGIAASKGDIVIILDADDELVSGWPNVLSDVLDEWPVNCYVCYAACRNLDGLITSEEPAYNGELTMEDILNERHSGEYLPLFKGEYIRSKKYTDLGMRKSCGIVSYIKFSLDAPFWVTNRVLRIYHDTHEGSVSSGWSNPDKASETVRCYKNLFEKYSDLYRKEAPAVWRTKQLRLAIYLRLAGLPKAWYAWGQGASIYCLKETLGALFVLIFGAKVGSLLVVMAKKYGLVRRYG